jgi:hypothetical protein
MMIDCDTCAVRGPACDDCVVTVLLGAPPSDRNGDRNSDGHCIGPGAGQRAIDLDGREQAAIAVLAGSGLVPPLRLVAASPADDPAGDDQAGDDPARDHQAPDDEGRSGRERRTAV